MNISTKNIIFHLVLFIGIIIGLEKEEHQGFSFYLLTILSTVLSFSSIIYFCYHPNRFFFFKNNFFKNDIFNQHKYVMLILSWFYIIVAFLLFVFFANRENVFMTTYLFTVYIVVFAGLKEYLFVKK